MVASQYSGVCMSDSHQNIQGQGACLLPAICFVSLLLLYAGGSIGAAGSGPPVDVTGSGGDGFRHRGDIVIDASLRTANDTGQGTQVGDDIASITYDSSRGILVGNLGGILWQNMPDQHKLSLGGHISFTMEGCFFDTHPVTGINYATNQHLLTATGGNGELWQLRHAAGQQLVFVLNPAIDMQYIRTGGGTRGAWGGVRIQQVDISWSGSQMSVYVDHYPVWKGLRSMQMDFSSIYLGSRGASWENALGETWVRDFKVSTMPVVLQGNPVIGKIGMFGDSFIANAQYPKVGGASNYNFAIGGTTPDNAAGTCFEPSDQFGDYGLIPSIHRNLNSYGIYPANERIANWSEKSSGVTTGSCNLLSSRVDTAVSGAYPVPDAALFVIGTNDVANGESDWDIWKIAYLAEIDKLIALNPDIIIIANIAPMTPERIFDTLAYRAAVDSANLAIAELPTERRQISVVDVFNALGGHDNWNQSDFNVVNDRHPSAAGYQKYADLFVGELLTRYSSSSPVNAAGSSSGGCALSGTGRRPHAAGAWWLLLAFLVVLQGFRHPARIRR
jgi:lysophospholipase L1-like esterase